MNNLEIKNIRKVYNDRLVLNDVSFKIKQGEFLSILGASGCGKTTLLKIIIGIEEASDGVILKDSEDITNLDPSLRGMGMVFQNYALFPNMTVLENVVYALNLKLKDKVKSREEAIKMLKVVNMEEHLNKRPHELYGGQQQRVAIARTLALKPDIILFDEPMSALDADNRLGLRKKIKEIQKEFNTTMIYITHDQEEAFSLSDKVMIMQDGNVVQLDRTNVIYNHPANEYVKNFVTNHLKEKVSSIEKCTGIDL